jgi:hypothetical protein
VTQPIAGSLDCPHAPHCSAATGCHAGAVPVSWALKVERWGGRWKAFSWQHPRESTVHRSIVGEFTDAPPKWAK